MWYAILIFTAIAAALCGVSAALLRLQRIGAQPGLVNRFAGLTIGRGFRITNRLRLNGDRQLMVATIVAWLMWTALGGCVIAIVSPGYDPQRMWLVYGILCAIVGAAIGFGLAFFVSAYYAKITRMSNFEGAAGYFVMFMALIGAVLGALALGIAMTLFFHQQGH